MKRINCILFISLVGLVGVFIGLVVAKERSLARRIDHYLGGALQHVHRMHNENTEMLQQLSLIHI